MENFASFILSACLIGLFLRLLARPIRAVWKLLLHAGCGFLCLWLLNSAAGLTGLSFPLNLVTVLTAGLGGLPGIALLAALRMMG